MQNYMPLWLQSMRCKTIIYFCYILKYSIIAQLYSQLHARLFVRTDSQRYQPSSLEGQTTHQLRQPTGFACQVILHTHVPFPHFLFLPLGPFPLEQPCKASLQCLISTNCISQDRAQRTLHAIPLLSGSLLLKYGYSIHAVLSLLRSDRAVRTCIVASCFPSVLFHAIAMAQNSITGSHI